MSRRYYFCDRKMVSLKDTTMIRLIVFCFVFGISFVGVANATSFNCGQASTPREHLICSNKTLSDEDSQLGEIYKSALARFTPSGAVLLRDGQRNWLSYLQTTCPVLPEGDRTKAIQCVSAAYIKQIAYLQEMSVQEALLADPPEHYDAAAESLLSSIQKNLPSLLGQKPPIIQAVFDTDLLTSAQSLNQFPAPPDAQLNEAIHSVFLGDPSPSLTFEWLPGVNFGVAIAVGGELQCAKIITFKSDGKQTREAPLPEVLQTDLCAGEGNFAAIGLHDKKIVAITASMSGNNLVMALQIWEGTGWSKPAAFSAALLYPADQTTNAPTTPKVVSISKIDNWQPMPEG